MIAVFIVLILGAVFLLGGTLVSNNPAVPAPAGPSDAIRTMAQAIAKAEGSPSEWNNPGDLTISFGFPVVGVANSAGVLKFASPVDGWNALYKQLSAIVNGTSRYSLQTTIADFGAGYSGGDPNWAVNVANALGVSPNTPLGDVLS